MNMTVMVTRTIFLSIKEYLSKIRPYLSDLIKDFKIQDRWKFELMIGIDFISSKDSKYSTSTSLHIKNSNIEIVIRNETDEIIEEIF